MQFATVNSFAVEGVTALRDRHLLWTLGLVFSLSFCCFSLSSAGTTGLYHYLRPNTPSYPLCLLISVCPMVLN